MDKLSWPEIERRAGQLDMCTWHLLGQLADGMPLDVTDPEDLKIALSSTSLDLVFAFDEGRIQFERSEERALFAGLLATAINVVVGGKFGTAGGRAEPCH